jgi:RecJ-like exonuclease
LQETALEIANKLRDQDFIKIVTHIDADGISAGSIASAALEREGIPHEIEFVKKLDEKKVLELKDEFNKTSHASFLVWFTDLGSGQLEIINGFSHVITDHHSLKSVPNDLTRESRVDLLKFSAAIEESQQGDKNHLNPHLFGHDGSLEISGAGTVYYVAKALNPEKNIDLSVLAIVGAVGDLQDSANCKLIGLNRDILNDAVSTGGLEIRQDIRFFGRETRPIHNLLQYANDPVLPDFQKNERYCLAFLRNLGIPLKKEERWRRWVDLKEDEKQSIISELITYLLSKGVKPEIAKRVIGEVYILTNENEGTTLHDAKEFATLLNSCGRYKRSEVAYHICLGDRNEWLNKAQKLQQGHRAILVESIQIVKQLGITELDHIQYFHSGDQILDDIVGTVAGMILGSGGANRSKPLFGLAVTEDEDGIKVSARADRKLLAEGLDLSIVMKTTSEQVGGIGGGHNIAAGATIPVGKEDEFLKIADEVVNRQLNLKI